MLPAECFCVTFKSIVKGSYTACKGDQDKSEHTTKLEQVHECPVKRYQHSSESLITRHQECNSTNRKQDPKRETNVRYQFWIR